MRMAGGGGELQVGIRQECRRSLSAKAAKNRPKKRATLVSHAKSSLGKNPTDAQGEAVVEELRKAGKLKFDEKGAVEYRV